MNIGVQGENSRQGQSQNLVIPLRALAKFKSPLGKPWVTGLDLGGGAEVGENMEQQVYSLTLLDGSEFKKPVAIQNKNIRRAVGLANLNVTRGDRFSFQGSFSYRKLFRAEQFIKTVTVPASVIPSDPTRVGSPGPFSGNVQILEVRQDSGIRRMLDLQGKYEVSKFFDISARYQRGELAPTFTFVHLFMVGFTIKYAGK